jgi:hypothetical protein
MDVMRPWIANRIFELMGGQEDDIIVDTVINTLQGDVGCACCGF